MTTPVADALIVAAGRGSRAGEGAPKQYRAVGGLPLLTRTLQAFADAPGIRAVMAVIHPDDADAYAACVAALTDGARRKMRSPAMGGATRQASVRAGLDAMAVDAPGLVLVHDGARPHVSRELIARAIAAAAMHGAAVPGLAMTDTVKEIDASDIVLRTPDRRLLRAVQTPQAFDFAAIRAAHARAAASGRSDLTDDAAVAEWAGLAVHVFPGDPANTKYTTAADFEAADLRHAMQLADVRVGQGFDVHAFAPGDHVWLGGLRIAHDKTLVGHSDADVLLHAMTDAILGALGDGDIGSHFPPSDPRWRGMASHVFLAHAIGLVRQRGGAIAHLDGTIVCEAPKIGPHREAMRTMIASICGLALDRVAVKATTSEKLGFTGRSEGIAAMATATLRLPWGPA